MKNFVKNFQIKLKIWIVDVLLKKAVIPFALSMIYIFVLGPTSLLAKLCFKDKINRSSRSRETNWHEINYDFDKFDDLRSQS